MATARPFATIHPRGSPVRTACHWSNVLRRVCIIQLKPRKEIHGPRYTSAAFISQAEKLIQRVSTHASKTKATRTNPYTSLLRTQESQFVTPPKNFPPNIFTAAPKPPGLPMLACKRPLGTNGTLPVLLPEELPPVGKRQKLEPTKARKLRQQRKKYVA